MSKNNSDFDELLFFAQIKARPGIYFGEKSLLSLRNYLFGMEHAFSFCCKECTLKYFYSFTQWYTQEYVKDINTYACWWNHLLYTNGNFDNSAFDAFFRYFEKYLQDIHNITLPDLNDINS